MAGGGAAGAGGGVGVGVVGTDVADVARADVRRRWGDA